MASGFFSSHQSQKERKDLSISARDQLFRSVDSSVQFIECVKIGMQCIAIQQFQRFLVVSNGGIRVTLMEVTVANASIDRCRDPRDPVADNSVPIEAPAGSVPVLCRIRPCACN